MKVSSSKCTAHPTLFIQKKTMNSFSNWKSSRNSSWVRQMKSCAHLYIHLYIHKHTVNHQNPPTFQQSRHKKSVFYTSTEKQRIEKRENELPPKHHTGPQWIHFGQILNNNFSVTFSVLFFLPCFDTPENGCLTHHADHYLSHENSERISHALYLFAQKTHKHTKQTHQHLLISSLHYFV